MALVLVLEFQELAAQLTEKETKYFLVKLLKSDPGLIIHALSSHFINRLNDANDSAQNARCNKIISTIIRSRETDTNHEEDSKRFDTLPRRIIGVCASYLDQVSYAALSATNRSSYLGCIDPNMLNEVHLDSRGSEIIYPDLSAFPFATKLCLPRIYSMDLMHSFASQISKMPRLHALDLSKTPWPLIRMITNDDVINARITSAVFSKWQRSPQFIVLIAHFKNIQFLKGRIRENRVPDEEWKTESLIESLSNLKALDFNDNGIGIEWDILQSVGHRLEYLTLHDREEHFYRSAEQTQINFVNLRQLRQGHCCVHDCIRIIMKTAVHLEKVRVFDEDLLEDVLMQCAKLKYLEIEEDGHGSFEDILQTLERSLFSNRTIQRDTFKIQINTSSMAVIKCKQHVTKLNRIINLFSENHVDQWMLIIHIARKEKEKDGQLIHDFARALTSDICSTAVLDCENYVAALITNPGCTICGWRESWLMSS